MAFGRRGLRPLVAVVARLRAAVGGGAAGVVLAVAAWMAIPVAGAAAETFSFTANGGSITGSYPSFTITGPDNTTGGRTASYGATASTATTYTFSWSYLTRDIDAASETDPAGFVVNGTRTYLINSGSASGSGTRSFTVAAGQSFNWFVSTTDGCCGPGVLSVSVTATASAPTAANVSTTVAANSSANPVTLSVTGTATSVAVASGASHGTATASGTAITYTPTAGYSGTDSFTYTATNATGTSAPATVSVTVTPATLALSPTTLADMTEGTATAQTVTAANGTAPYAFSIGSGALPPGVTLSAAGAISGTPTAAGSYTVSVDAVDTYGAVGSRSYTVSVADAIPTAAPVSATVAANASATPIGLSTTGTVTAVAVASAPTHGTATASGTTINYTPAAGFSGTDSFTYTASNATGTSAAATVSITVSPPTLAVTPASLPDGVVGTAYAQTLAASGGTAPYTFSLSSGTLPPGLSLSASGGLSGTPTASGAYGIVVGVEDAFGATGTAAYTLDVGDAVPVAAAVSVTVAADASATPIPLAVTGTATSVSVVAAPAHGTATASGTTIAYTPDPGYAGSDSFTYAAANASGTSAPATVLITVTASAVTITVTPARLASATVGKAYAVALTAAGGTAPYAFTTDAAALPDGLALSSAGRLAGTPTSAGDFTVTVGVEDANGALGSRTYALTVSDAAPTASDRTVEVDGTSGGDGVALALVSGPDLCVVIETPPRHGTATVNADCTVTYVPAAGYSGTDAFTYYAVDTVTAARSAAARVTVRIAAVIALAPAGRLDPATVGEPYAVRFSASGGRAPYRYHVADGTVPAGLALSPGGLLSGTPTTAGRSVFRVRVTDALSATAEETVTLPVAAAPRPDPSRDPEVIGVVNAEVDAARRIGLSQVDAIGGHLAGLRGADCLAGGVEAGFGGGAAEPVRPAEPPTAADESLDRAAGPARPHGRESRRDRDRSPDDAGCSPIADGRVAVWIGGSVDFGSRPVKGDEDALDFVSVALSGGIDWKAGDTLVLGVGVGLNRDRTEVGANGSAVEARGLSVFTYGSWQPTPQLFLDGLVGYGRLAFDSDRAVPSTGDTATASRDGDLLFASVTAGTEWSAGGGLKLTPYGRLTAARAWLGAAGERGAGALDLVYGGQTVDTLTAGAGLKLAWTVVTEGTVIAPFLTLEYGHDFAGASDLDLRYADSDTTYTLTSADRASDFATLGLGADIAVGEDLSLGIAYGVGLDADGVRGQRVDLRLSGRF